MHTRRLRNGVYLLATVTATHDRTLYKEFLLLVSQFEDVATEMVLHSSDDHSRLDVSFGS